MKEAETGFTSMIGLDANTFFSICVSVWEPPTVAKYRMAYLADTVFPAPDSPDTIIDWSLSSLQQSKHFVITEGTNKMIDAFQHLETK